MIRTAVIPAAGFGTRFLPATKATPKELLPVLDRPVIQHVVEEAVAAGCDDIVIVLGPDKEAIRHHFEPDPVLDEVLAGKGDDARLASLRGLLESVTVRFAWQEERLGLGHALLCARADVGAAPFAVLLGDTILAAEGDAPPVTAQLVETFAAEGGPVVACERLPRPQLSRYGVVAGEELRDGVLRLSGLVEKPDPAAAPSDLAIASRYVFTPDIFDHLAATGRGRGNEIQLTDAMAAQAAARPCFARRISGTRLDVGHPAGLIRANLELALRDPVLADDLTPWLRRRLGGA